jgi:hypothetical protein
MSTVLKIAAWVVRKLQAEPWELKLGCWRSRQRIGRWEFSDRLFPKPAGAIQVPQIRRILARSGRSEPPP